MSKIMNQLQIVINLIQVYEKENKSQKIIEQNKLKMLKNIHELTTLAITNWQEIDKSTKNIILETIQYINNSNLISIDNISSKKIEEVQSLIENIKKDCQKLIITIEPKPSINQFIIESNILKLYENPGKFIQWENLYTNEYELYCDMRDIVLNKTKQDIKHLYIYSIATMINKNLNNIDYNLEDPATKQFLDLLNFVLQHPKAEEYNQRLQTIELNNIEKIETKVKRKQGQII